MPISDKEQKDFANQLNRDLLNSGFTWVLASSFLAVFYLVFYHLVHAEEALSNNYNFFHYALVCLALACISYYLCRNQHSRSYAWYVPCTFLGIFWLLIAYDVQLTWYANVTSETLLMAGFFIFLLGFHTQPGLLFVCLPFIIAGDFYIITFISPPENKAEIFASLMLYPILYFFFRVSISKFYRQAKQKYIENVDLVSQLKAMSVTDELTGIGNRKAFNEGLKLHADISQRQGNNMTLVILDIDHFKQYNDCLGHPQGDSCLQLVAKLLQKNCRRGSDLVTRMGGEEFALILSGSNGIQASQLVRHIMDELYEENIPHPGSSVSDRVTISFGIAEFHNQDLETLYKQADHALYQAKQNGRNQYSIAS